MSTHTSLSLPGEALPGEALTPGDDGYDEAAATMFAAGTPDLVVRPHDAAGVAAAVRYAAETGLTVSVRSGGHSMAGLSTHTDGIVIDLRRLDAVEILDRASRLVRVGAGATWGAVSKALIRGGRPPGLAGPNGFSLTAGDTASVGVGGLTLSGGIGWMARRYGLAIDNLAGADLVTADGRQIRADARENRELFWALRGGGGNFGVVTSFDFIAQPVTTVHFGTITYDSTDLPRLIRGWRELMLSSDENLTVSLAAMPPMMGQPTRIVATCCYASPGPGWAAAALGPFRRLAPVSADDIRVVPYTDVLTDAKMPPGLRVEMRNTFLPTLDDGLAEAIGELYRAGAVLELRGLGGAVARVPADATAFAHRNAEALLTAGVMLPQSSPWGVSDEKAAISGMRPQDAAGALAGWPAIAARGAGAYVGFLGRAEQTDVEAAYPPATYRRLAAVKRRYDTGNMFRRNHNILPAGA